jgi:hypothetical protein
MLRFFRSKSLELRCTCALHRCTICFSEFRLFELSNLFLHESEFLVEVLSDNHKKSIRHVLHMAQLH